MKQKSKFKRIIGWFFEELDDEENSLDVNNNIELSIQQLVLLVVVAMLFISWLLYGHFIEYKKRSAANYKKPSVLIKENIEKDFFNNKNGIENGDFSRGLEHWNTSDGGKTFKNSKSRITITKEHYHSEPYSLKIESINPGNRVHYYKSDRKTIIQNPYSFKSFDVWMGVLPGKKVTVSFWYKGDIIVCYLHGLDKNGVWSGLAKISGEKSSEWRKLQLESVIPPNGRAIALEFTVNRAIDDPLPVVYIDDVSIALE